ncbi:ATP12 family chaperone protein [Ferrovibrio sp.]|uniref:ATP12 family chaperone protein n=1 Tax=Ferrovibrio sp. TaxID=1917215 RepID=UPI000CBB0011|nr:ATP12 family protein [Ferrovibrio sp.]PJI37704.1 MAG: ATPase [Ferrovibrio sp.]
MKRFYKLATAEQAEGGAIVRLDGRVLKTPAKAEMHLPTLALAEAIAGEWQAQQDEIRPQSMPLMQLAATAIDRVMVDASFASNDLVRYGETDLLSYRADEPATLAERQAAEWQPLLDWFRDRYDVQMNVTSGIIAVAQPTELKPRLERVCAGLDAWRLTALHGATTNSGSVVIGLALLDGRLDADGAHRVALLDEMHQAERWGEDAEAVARRTGLLADLQAAARFLALLPARR